jgi:hypothetical protein
MSAKWVVGGLVAVAALSSVTTLVLVRRGPAGPTPEATPSPAAAELAAARAELQRTRALLAPFEQAARDRFGAEGTQELAQVAGQLAVMPTPAPASATATAPAPNPAPEAMTHPKNALRLTPPVITQVPEGFKATLQFTPSTEDPLEPLAVIVRIPRAGSTQILSLVPRDPAAFTNITQRIAPEGKFAAFSATAVGVKPVEFDLIVSGAAKASLRGTCGIEPIDFEIGTTPAP